MVRESTGGSSESLNGEGGRIKRVVLETLSASNGKPSTVLYSILTCLLTIIAQSVGMKDVANVLGAYAKMPMAVQQIAMDVKAIKEGTLNGSTIRTTSDADRLRLRAGIDLASERGSSGSCPLGSACNHLPGEDHRD